MKSDNEPFSQVSSTVQNFDRPHVWIESITFSDGQKYEIARDEVLVFVGPNNAGKSAAVREISDWLFQGKHSSSPDYHVVTQATIDVLGEPTSEWLDGSYKSSTGLYQIPMLGSYRMDIIKQVWGQGGGINPLKRLLVLHLDTASRLQLTNPVDAIDVLSEVAIHPLHKLYEDDHLEAKLDKIFSANFNLNLVVNRGGGRAISLHVGKRPQPENGDRQSKQFRQAVNLLPPLHSQGDGIRAFVGILMGTLVADRDVLIVDEPEAFLHPPQAYALGKVLVDQAPQNRQLIVATHSSDFLRGVLDSARSRVRVIRITRDGNVNHTCNLSPQVVHDIWGDPILRYSKVFDSIFHNRVVVCESDADCRFYATLLDTIGEGSRGLDIAFVHGSGKHRIPVIVKALKAIGVPVRVIADFDVLADEKNLSAIIQALGGDWSSFETSHTVIKSAVEQRRAQIDRDDTKAELIRIIDGSKAAALNDQEISQLRQILKRGSAWGEAKKIGKKFIPSGTATATYNSFEDGLLKVGLHIVDVGELEGFCPSIGNHGPAWVNEVLTRNLAADPELEDARRFGKRVIEQFLG